MEECEVGGEILIFLFCYGFRVMVLCYIGFVIWEGGFDEVCGFVCFDVVFGEFLR